MIEHIEEVVTAAGTMPTFAVHPSEGGPFPVIIFYMDIWGIREELRDIARQTASCGYCCLLPDLFYREGLVRNEFRDANGRMTTLEKLTDAQKEQVRGPLRRLSDAMVMHDTDGLLKSISSLASASSEKVTAVGYCMGGRHALVAAGTFPDQFAVAASLHGTALVHEGEPSPHKVAARSRGHLYCGFGELDPHARPSVVEALKTEFHNSTYRYVVHAKAHHGYALPDRDVYNKFAANRDWELIHAMMQASRQNH